MTHEEGLKMRLEVQAHCKELGDAVRGSKQKTGADGWFQNILLALATECQLNACEVVEGDSQRQLPRVAWCCSSPLTAAIIRLLKLVPA
jgi:hypothetical protein